jgi:hypothetical protein
VTNQGKRVAGVWRATPSDPDPELSETRFAKVFTALKAVGLEPVPVVYSEEGADSARRQLLGVQAALVWVDPIMEGVTRASLDAVLREVAAQGVLVSTHPDVILKLGTTEVLYQTRDMPWGSDCRIYRSPDELRRELLPLLARGPRVLKQLRGNTGQGVWKLELVDASSAQVQMREAVRRGVVQTVTMDEALHRLDAYFDEGGCIIDQPYLDLSRGMVRAYMVQDRVAGFGQQYVTALAPLPPGVTETPLPPPRLYYGADQPEFKSLRRKLEGGWLAEMQRILELETASLPMIWDADFIAGAEDAYTLCEINVSSVFPFPDQALEPLAAAVQRALT